MQGGFDVGLAAVEAVLEGGFEVAGVPGVGDVAAAAGVGHQELDLMVGVAGDDVFDAAQIGGVHADNVVEVVVVPGRYLTRCLCGVKHHTVIPKALFCRGIDAVADFFRAHGGRFGVEEFLHVVRPCERFEDKLGHGRTANVAVADKKDFVGFEVRHDYSSIRVSAPVSESMM